MCGDMGMGLCWLVKRGGCSSEKNLPGPQVVLWGRRMVRRQGESPGRVLAGCCLLRKVLFPGGEKTMATSILGAPGGSGPRAHALGVCLLFYVQRTAELRHPRGASR